MKKHLTLIALAALLLIAGCSKEKRCKCTFAETLDDHNNPAVTYVHVNSGFRCSKITQLGYERLSDGALVRDMEGVTCEDARD